jgi:hypothetical protein
MLDIGHVSLPKQYNMEVHCAEEYIQVLQNSALGRGGEDSWSLAQEPVPTAYEYTVTAQIYKSLLNLNT